MGMEILGADITSGPVKMVGEEKLSSEIENKAKTNLGQEEETTNVGTVDGSNGANGEFKDKDSASHFPKDAVDEWPAPKQIHSFYLIKFRSYEDPKMKLKLEQADKEIQKKNQARYQITEALKAKRSERAGVVAQLRPLTSENKQYNEAMNEKMKEMEPLQTALGKLRNANNAVREKGIGLCSSEEELNDLIKSIHYRISHESITLDEEKQLLREIKQLEATRGKVISQAAMRAKLQDSLGHKEAIQDQVKLVGADMDAVKKERQAVRGKIKPLEEQLKAIDAEISSLQDELTSVSEKKDKAFENLNELRKARDAANSCYFQNRSLLNNAKELAAKKDIAALETLAHSEVEKFMLQWSNDKEFREDYERRILPSLDSRQLSRDGRMRNPDEKPIIAQETRQSTEAEVAPIKSTAKQTKEAAGPISRADSASTEKLRDKEIAKVTEVDSKEKKGNLEDTVKSHDAEKTQKELPKKPEIDAETLKQMKRDEQIAKNKLALERKKKLAEKSAAQAAAKAQKEVEKRQKEKEKRARKKAAAQAPGVSDELIETEEKNTEEAEAKPEVETLAPAKAKELKETVRYKNIQKNQSQLPKVILKRKKSHQSYWKWVAPAAALALVLAIFAYLYLSRVN
ncbi:proton pump-interactor 1-like [Ananas comosus]|uniref:Proton pump-interactor 1-like n=1 Tax=Ananas comosus TaxID=4615 RepID=A0A6P5FSN8_ANACO|nr:proton pump-interactor 1-like [Ananas comosus]